jgi:hypothetical protein
MESSIRSEDADNEAAPVLRVRARATTGREGVSKVRKD